MRAVSRNRADRNLSDLNPERAARSEREARTQRLLAAAQHAGSPQERQRLREVAVALNRELALSVAHRYHGRGMEGEDIDQVALLALWKAVLRYRPRDDATFAAYAIPTITGEVKRHFRDHGWAVRPPRALQERTMALVHAVDALRQVRGREPTAAELCRYLDVDEAGLHRAAVAREAYRADSLDNLVPGTELALGDTLADPTDQVDRAETALMLRQAISRLPERDRVLLRLRYGHGLTQTQIGRRLGVSQMQVSRLLQRVHSCLEATLAPEAC